MASCGIYRVDLLSIDNQARLVTGPAPHSWPLLANSAANSAADPLSPAGKRKGIGRADGAPGNPLGHWAHGTGRDSGGLTLAMDLNRTLAPV